MAKIINSYVYATHNTRKFVSSTSLRSIGPIIRIYEKLIRKEPVVDESGDIIKQLIISSGYTVVGYDLIPDDKIKILKAFVLALENPQVDVIISTGGTGYSLTDVTVETIRPLFDREIEGFSDIFRLVSYNDPEVKSASYLTKA
ncbi:hypothetical protein DJ526_12570, partial [Sulfolobus sp. A20-N-G8]